MVCEITCSVHVRVFIQLNTDAYRRHVIIPVIVVDVGLHRGSKTKRTP